MTCRLCGRGRYQPRKVKTMSVRIGEVLDPTKAQVVAHVGASTAGVEVNTEARLTFDPVEARNYAALLVRAADEVERMRGR